MLATNKGKTANLPGMLLGDGDATRYIGRKNKSNIYQRPLCTGFICFTKKLTVFLYYGRIQTNSHTADAMFDFLIIFNPTDNSRAPRDKS